MITRRTVTLGLGALALAGCGAPAPLRGPEPAMRAVPNPAFDAWAAGFRARAASRGISEATLSAAFRGAGYLPGVIERDRNQAEFTRSLEDYLSIAASDDRISLGRQMLARHAGVLSQIESRFGVQPHVITAFWGLESFYGTRRGEVPVISALSTLAYDGRRGAFFESQLFAALRILQSGDVNPAAMTGSWAGAMGHTQFIPTSFLEYAVDFGGDGRRDIWADDPADALASTANYLARSGWQRSRPWGLEVRVPEGFAGPLGRGSAQSVAAWTAAGFRAADGAALQDHGPGAVLVPQRGGPAFLVYRNFSAILRYNNAETYAIGIGHLSDRLSGRGPLRSGFPPDAQGMSKADRQELQRRLTAAGFDTEGADGVIGARTRAAIAAYERAQGLPVTGEPSLALLRRLGG
jgi:lytic murein transglycosylase